MKKYLFYISFMAGLTAFTNCYQDLDQDPPFDYPEEVIPQYNPQKLLFTFEGNAKNVSTYKIPTLSKGNITYTEGKKGKAYQGGEGTYVLISPRTPRFAGDISLKDTIANLGSFTVAFWMKCPQVNKGTGIFSISNTKNFWGNLDIFLDGNQTAGEGRFKVYLRNGGKDKWVEKKFSGTIDEWVHMTFRYNSKTEKFDILKNGEEVFATTLTGWGRITCNDMGDLVLGTFSFQTDPPQSSDKAQTWAQSFPGKLENFAFYNKALTDEQIKALYNE